MDWIIEKPRALIMSNNAINPKCYHSFHPVATLPGKYTILFRIVIQEDDIPSEFDGNHLAWFKTHFNMLFATDKKKESIERRMEVLELGGCLAPEDTFVTPTRKLLYSVDLGPVPFSIKTKNGLAYNVDEWAGHTLGKTARAILLGTPFTIDWKARPLVVFRGEPGQEPPKPVWS